MATRLPRPCKYPGCPELTRDGWCPAHRPRYRRGESAAYHGWYNLPVWTDKLRPAQLLREPFCRACALRGLRTRASVVDHIRPFRGDWTLFVDQANHQSLCKRCHDQKTMAERWGKRKRK